ncbi:MAG: lipase family protein [Spirochaetales bacterium]
MNTAGSRVFLIGSMILLALGPLAQAASSSEGGAGAEPTVPVADSAGRIIEASFDQTYDTATVAELLPVQWEDLAPPEARYAVEVYIVDFGTTDLDGDDTPTRMQLLIPKLADAETTSEASEVPFYLLAPGSTGLVDSCRPSREHVIGVDWGRYQTHALAHASQGTIVAIPDYMNSMVEGEIQPYFIAEAEANVVLDTDRAVRAFFASEEAAELSARPTDGTILVGYSQGGHAIFAAADRAQAYAPEVQIAGILGYGPSTNVENLFREWTVAAPLVTYSYATVYGEDAFDPSLILADRWLTDLAHDATSQCIGAIQRFYPTEPEPLYREAFLDALLDGRLAEEYPEIHRIMAQNDAGLSGHGFPVLILAGTNDVVVYPESQDAFVAALREEGSAVEYVVYENARHDTRQVGFVKAQEWIRAITAGKEPFDRDLFVEE